MMDTGLTIALAQPLVVPGEIEHNADAMIPLITDASREHADVVLFSECGLTGYDRNGVGPKSAVGLDHPAMLTIRKVAQACNVVVINGFYEKEAELVYNTVFAIHPDGSMQIQRKHCVSPPEAAWVSVGPRQRTRVMIGGVACAIVICADYAVPALHEEMAAEGFQAVFLLTA